MAALIGIGLVASPSMSRHSGKQPQVRLLRVRRTRPARKAATRSIMSRGTMLPTTEITPSAPTANNGSVRLSSPLRTVRLVIARTCEA